MHFYIYNMYFTQSNKVSKERKLFYMYLFHISYPVSLILYLVSCILYPASSIQYPVSSI